MSGNNRQGRQGGQGGQGGQQPQGGQPRGGQPQQGRGQRGQPPQGGGGGRPPQRGGGGGRDIDVDTSVVKNVVLWGVVAFAIAGVALGILPFLFGFAGDATGDTQQVRANSTAQDIQDERTEAANDIVSNALSDDNASAAAAYDQMQSQNRVIGSVIQIGPYLAIMFGLVMALLIGLRSGADEPSLAAGVFAAIIVGLVLFVVLSSAIAGFQYNSMSEDDWAEEYNTSPDDWSPYPESDYSDSTAESFDNADVRGGPLRVSDASISQPRQISDLRINYGTLFINSLLFGIITGLGGAGIAVGSKRLSENVS